MDRKKKIHGYDTNENRGYDQKGYENNVTMNTGHINRQKAADTNYLTVNGEGILMQAVAGSDDLRNLWYKNNLWEVQLDTWSTTSSSMLRIIRI